MKKMAQRLVAAGVLSAGLFVNTAQAMYLDSGELARNCLGERPEEISACMNYIAGVIDYHIVMQSLGTAPTTDFCLPEGLKIADAAYAVLSYMKTAPQNDAFIAAPTVVLALNSTYPCRAPKGKK